jgi:stearoyl-CoA desaturase (delta-9 desaturase)
MSARGRPNWSNIVFLIVSPIAAFAGVGWYVGNQGIRPEDLFSFFVMILFTGLSITAGYHRYYSHRSYECHWAVQTFYLLFGAAALQAPVLNWISEHRNHHRFVDTDADPYNINKGFFWAHVGWTAYSNDEPRAFDNIADLERDRLLLLQQRYHLPLGIAIGFGVPLLLGLIFSRPGGGLIWGGILRIVVAHHFTFLVNSWGHSFGRQPYSDKNSSRDSSILAMLTLGEGYHNFHHTFPGDYRNGVCWYHWDPTKWWIAALYAFGLAWRLNRTPVSRTLRSRAAMLGRQTP